MNSDNSDPSSKPKDSSTKDGSPKENAVSSDLYEEAKRSMIEKEWDEIFKNMKVDEEEYKIFLSFGTKMDDGRSPGPFRPIYPVAKK